jgi:uncharacterized membrane protein YfcA
MFILVNSPAGLFGQLLTNPVVLNDWRWLVLAGAVLVGDKLVARWGAWRIPQDRVRRLTGVIVLAAALRILWNRYF